VERRTEDKPYCFHPLFSGSGCLTSASLGGLPWDLVMTLLLLLWPATVIDGRGRGEGVSS